MKRAIVREDAAAEAGRKRNRVISLFGTGKIGAEIGVFRGDFSEVVVELARPEKYFLIDPWENQSGEDLKKAWYAEGSSNDMEVVHQGVQKRFAKEIAKGTVEIRRGYSQSVLSDFAVDSLDFIYIDGDHRYEGALADLVDAWRIVKPGGIIALDDYTLGGWWKGGVAFAVHHFIGRHARDLSIVLMMGNQIVLRKS
jgi:SAM-dependent methyltransferase